MNKKYQIFISSTFHDLEHERRIAIEQILNIDHIPIGMELFQASDDSQWSYIKRRILECDYYIVIIAERYGSEGPDGISYTQMEYEFAKQNEIPVAAFLLHEESRKSWPNEKVEFEKRDKLNSFRSLCSKKMCNYWRNSDELGAKIITSIIKLIQEHPRAGWVKSTEALSIGLAEEVASLSAEKRELEQKVKSITNTNANAQRDEISARLSRLARYHFHADGYSGPIEMTFLELLCSLAPNINHHETIDVVSEYIAMAFSEKYSSETRINISDSEISRFMQECEFIGAFDLAMGARNKYGIADGNKISYRISNIGRNIVISHEEAISS